MTLTRKLTTWPSSFGACLAFCFGMSFSIPVLAQEQVGYDLGELQSLSRAASLLDRQEYAGAEEAYRSLSNAPATSIKVKIAALEGEAFAMAAGLRQQVDEAANDSRNKFFIRKSRNDLLALLDQIQPQADTAIMSLIRAAVAEENALTAASFDGHQFAPVFRHIEEQGGALPAQKPVEVAVPKASTPVNVPGSESDQFAGTYVASRKANVRDVPTLAGSNVLRTLQPGTKVRVNARLTGADGGFWYLLDNNGGYVHASLLITEAQANAPAPSPRLPQTTDNTGTSPKREPSAPAPAPAPAPQPAANTSGCGGGSIGVYRVTRPAPIYDRPGGSQVGAMRVGANLTVRGVSGRFLIIRNTINGVVVCRYVDTGDPSKPNAYKAN